MQALKFIRYFFYLFTNWNFAIALHIISRERKGEKKYGIDTTGADELQSLQDKGIDTTHATIYMPASYDMLEDVFSKLDMKSISHFVDIGCGKGRVLAVAASSGIRKITGVDFSREFCDAAIKNLESVKQHYPETDYRVENNDAFYFQIPCDADCIFLFNPFDETIMRGVLQNILKSLQAPKREMNIIYFNPLNKEMFTKTGFKEVYAVKKLNYLEACILNKKPDK